MLKQAYVRGALAVTASVMIAVVSTGCDRKETVLDVDTPGGGGVEVERNKETGAVTVDVDESNP
ncbi:hypothetical protein [Allorhodopirellula solitaria]|uniref:Uncharacterized protein n=1 Tax=Allorhodopirellula solitaria TaxID=2527987 RepID=A0A5C5YJX6_9BACT|nr:hypothetical protein [Allorhodopirellula solitaria]TWT75203.1 hypothetical protein CA85_04920 [Allorhodopirellula solitaria]